MGGTPTIPPPPDPTDANLKSTTGDKIGGFLGAISNGGVLGTISDAFKAAHEKRLGKAKMYHDVMLEKLPRSQDQSLSDEDRKSAQAAYDAAKAEYLKLAPDPETKKNMQMRTAVAEHHVASQNGQPSPSGLTPPPTPGSSQPAAGTPAAGGNTTVPPPPAPSPSPDMTDTMAGIPGEMRADADKRTLRMKQAESDIEEKRQVAVEKSKPSAAAKPSTPASDAYFSLLDQIDPKTGQKYTAQDALKIVTDASTKAGKPDPFHEYLADPENYKKFQSEMAKAKQTPGKSAGIGAVYGIYRMLEMGYKQNPEILPVVAQLAPQVFASAGMKIPPAMAEALGKVPLDQPLSPETGQPIGTGMPGAPTAGTRTQAQTAARIITGDPSNGVSPIDDIRKEVKDLSGYLGPAEGRINVKYLLGKAGSTGDPDKDKKLSQLRTDLTFLASAAAKFHLNSVRAMDQFEKLADSGKDSAAALDGFLDSVTGWAKAAQRQERGAGETGEMTAPPSAKGKLTIDEARDYLKKAGGDKDKARKQAKADGREF